MLPNLLKPGDRIGIVSPSHIAAADRYKKIITGIEAIGFRVRKGPNLFKSSYGYLASELERADDFNGMVYDKTVKMIFFGGGYGGLELLPLIDYERLMKNPKIILSYSDGTSILNAIHSKTGLITFYGQAPGFFEDLRHDVYERFAAHFLRGPAESFSGNGRMKALSGGSAEGILVGGYTQNFALLMGGEYFTFDRQSRYILFLEDHEKFGNVAAVSMYLAHIEQSPFIRSVAGLLFGHYSESICPELMDRLRRFGAKHRVPVVYSDEFGHGNRHEVLPIGCRAVLDADRNRLTFGYPGV